MWFNYGVTLVSAQQYDAAIVALKRSETLTVESGKAQEVDVRYQVGLYLNLGIAYRHTEKIDEALTALEKALKIAEAHSDTGAIDPKRRAKVLTNLGLAHLAAHHMEESERYLRLALATDPSDVSLIKNVAVLYYKQGRLDEGIDFLDVAMKTQPEMELSRLRQQLIRQQKQIQRQVEALYQMENVKKVPMATGK